jgi:hypothetical protein
MPESEQMQVSDYNWLLLKVSSYVFDEENLPFNFFKAQIGRADLNVDLAQAEWLWLQYNLGFLKKIVFDSLPASMMFIVHKTS